MANPLLPNETQIQRAVVQHLSIRAAHGVCWFAIPNGGRRSRPEAAIMAGLGVRAGVPDLAIIRDGRFFGLELKTVGGCMSPAQTAMHEELRNAGATVATTRGLDAALKTLTSWGMFRDTTEGW